MMTHLQHAKITCYILYLFFGNFYLLLFHQQVRNFDLNFRKKTDEIVYLGMLGGWLCFTVSILIIGALTAVIGDLATHVNSSIDVFLYLSAIFSLVVQLD